MKIRYKGEIEELPEESKAEDLAIKLKLTAPNEALGVKINGHLADLSHPLQERDDIEFIHFSSPEGKEIFWHTSAHVLAQAVIRIWPEAKPTIGPPIEKGFYYDFADLHISQQDFLKIEKEMQKIINENYKPRRETFANKSEALKIFSDNPYKKELIESFAEEPITLYRQGEFFDLCRGPHLPNLSKIKAFKILKTSGAYWRGDSSKEMLTRIYAISFPERKNLVDYLQFLEEAQKRDHKILGKQLGLFGMKEEAPGMPFIYPKGMIIWENLLFLLREHLKKRGYKEIKTPTLLKKDLWVRSGHWQHYRENMYTSQIENIEYAIKPMNCPGCMLFYKSYTHSYREFPLKISEIGNVYRHEFSGALNGLFRVRSFHLDDAHVFTDHENLKKEILEILSIAESLYMTFGLPYHLELSTRPEKTQTIGSDEDWDLATKALKEALEEWGHSYETKEGTGAFYGPKIDLHIRDALERTWQCGTIQVDFFLPERFDLSYITKEGTHKCPIMIHRALFGSVERFFAILIEHFAGKFPLWISPHAIRLIPVADRHIPYAQEILDTIIQRTDLPSDIDMTNESVSKKIRSAQLLKINYMITVGDQEMQSKTVSIRARDCAVHRKLSLSDFLEKICKERNERLLISPFTITE